MAAGRRVTGLGAEAPSFAATAAPTGPLRHGTRVLLPWAANPPLINCWLEVGAKILLWVNKGTESCASERRPSYARNRNVLSRRTGNPRLPPNCCRLREFLTGAPLAVRLKFEKVGSGASAGLNAKGSRASMASLRKNPKTPPCTVLEPDLVTMLMEAAPAPPNSAG